MPEGENPATPWYCGTFSLQMAKGRTKQKLHEGRKNQKLPNEETKLFEETEAAILTRSYSYLTDAAIPFLWESKDEDDTD